MKHPGGAGASGAGHSAKHTRSKKHAHNKAKHNPKNAKTAHHTNVKSKIHTFAKHPSHPRGLAIGEALPVCTFEALAMSLRLAGQLVDDDEVAGLWALAGSPPLGATIAAALDAAREHGLAGFRPQRVNVPWFGPVGMQEHLPLPVAEDEAGSFGPFDDFGTRDIHALILGVDRPGPHAVLATPDGWWSWGRLWSPWTTAVSEAWEVSWL